MIKANNMVEDLLEWLKSRGYDPSVPVSLKDLDYQLLLTYARERGLIEVNDVVEEMAEEAKGMTEPEPEELGVDRRPTKPKKIRSKR